MAATSIASRYVSKLRSFATATATTQPNSSSPDSAAAGGVSDPGSSSAAHVFPGRRARTGLTCSGRDAADAAVAAVESPECSRVLTTWEAAKAAEGTTAVKDGEADANLNTEGPGFPSGPGLLESSSFARGALAPGAPIDGCFERGKGEDSNPSSEKERCKDDEEEEEGRQNERGLAGSLARAAEVLRALDDEEEEADPQGAPCLGEANAWVVKPAGLSCGRGVEVASSLRDLVAACRRLEWKAVVQKYVERPLLVQVGQPYIVVSLLVLDFCCFTSCFQRQQSLRPAYESKTVVLMVELLMFLPRHPPRLQWW